MIALDNFLKRFKTKKHSKILKSFNNKDIPNLRNKIKILMVDDEDYEIVDLLIARGYHIYYKKDIEYVEETEPFDIIIFDIKGVGKRLGSPMQGFTFAKEVKLIYQHKLVYCYSGTITKNISEQLNLIDGFIKKDTDIDKWVEKLDSFLQLYADVNYHWNIIKKQLDDLKIDINDISDMEKIYKESYQKDEFDNLKISFMSKIQDIKVYLGVLQSLVTLIKLLSK